MGNWGWVYSTKSVADFENISIDSAYNLPVIQYLNSLAYLKDYSKHKKAEYKNWEMKNKR